MGDIITRNKTGAKMTKTRRTFAPEFKLGSRPAGGGQGYTLKAACEAMGADAVQFAANKAANKVADEGVRMAAKALLKRVNVVVTVMIPP